MAKRLASVGSSMSNIVHVRVDYLIATQDAWQKSTQRVRKAAKLHIPVVKEDFVYACLADKATVPMEPYLFASNDLDVEFNDK